MDKFSDFCCVCTKKNVNLTSLDSADSNNVMYIDKLNLCVAKESWKEQYRLCDFCISQLEVAYNFIQCCLQSEKFRSEELNQIANNADSQFAHDKEIRFTCHECNKSFRQKKYLSQHITKLHINKKRKDNKKCSKRDQDDKPLVDSESDDIKLELEIGGLEEIKEEDLIEKALQDGCKDIEMKEETDFKLEKTDPSDLDEFGDITYNISNDVDNYDSCKEESEDNADLNKVGKHLGKKRGPKREPQKCNFCDELFTKRHAWATHIRTKHTFQKPFSCDQCDARYMNGYSLLIHKRKHTNEKPFICAKCGKSFVSSADLNHHNKIHDVDRAYPCPMCDRSFKTHSNLRTHRLQMHLDPAEWKFNCDLCDKRFPIRGNLVKHRKRHAGIKEFACHICEKSFVNRAELSLHLNTHTNQRLFKCKQCGKDYKNREGLRRHMKVVHDQGNWKAPKTEKKHLCPMCPKIFAFGNKLQRHIFTHTGEKPFKCDYCQKRFIDNYGRKVHYKKDHNMVEIFP